MSNPFMNVLQQIRKSAQNLSKDIDQNDSREKTHEDLEDLTMNFQELREIFSNLNEEDSQNLSQEARELFTGKEDFQTYTKDVKKILLDVKNRMKADKKVEDKITENLPDDKQDETPHSLLDGFNSLIEQISRWNEKAGSR